MEFHLLPIFSFLTLVLVAAHAASSPEHYWKSNLPTTPMPQAITNLLRLGGGLSPIDPNSQLLVWGTINEAQVQNDPNNPLFVYSWGQQTTNDAQLQNDPNNPLLIYGWGQGTTNNAQPHNDPNNPLLVYGWGRGTTNDAQPQNDPNNPLLVYSWGQGTINDAQPQNDPNNPLLVYSWGRGTTNDAQPQNHPNSQLLVRGTTNEAQLQNDPNNPLFVYSWGQGTTNDAQPQNDPNNPLLVYGWGRGTTNDVQLQNDPNNPLLVYGWGRGTINDDQPQNDPNSQLLIWKWGATNDAQQSQNDPNSQLLVWKWGATNDAHQPQNDPNSQLLVWKWGATNDAHQPQNDPNSQLLVWGRRATNEMNSTLFFLEDDLRPSTKMDLRFTKSKYFGTLLPREVTQPIPFSSDKIQEILDKFSTKPASEKAQMIEKTIRHCEEAGVKGEEKYCPTSLESMIDFITSKLGKNVQAFSTEVEKETQLQKFTVKPGVKKLAEDKVIACHQMHYPYAVFLCHKLMKTRAYFVPLEGADGARIKAIAVCHADTSDWNPNHLAFQLLKVKPGTVPICHFSPSDNVVWLPK